MENNRVNNKIYSLAKETLILTSKLAFPPIEIIYNAVKNENDEIKRMNMSQMILKLKERLDNVDILNANTFNQTENQLIYNIINEVGKEFEDIKQTAYANLLTNILIKNVSNDIALDILFQIQYLRAKDLIIFKEYYEKSVIHHFEINDKKFGINFKNIKFNDITRLEMTIFESVSLGYKLENQDFVFDDNAINLYKYAFNVKIDN